MPSKLTFEFPNARAADHFAGRVADEDLGIARTSHRTVDVLVHESAVEDAAHDAIVAMAHLLGADVPAPPKDERLYTLHTWDRDDEPRHTEVSITTLAAFFEHNPDDAAYIRAHHPDPTVPSAFEGGGGAAPRWRLTRTPFVGRRDETGIPQQRVFRREG